MPARHHASQPELWIRKARALSLPPARAFPSAYAPWAALLCAWLYLLHADLQAVELPDRSISSSGQFIIYAEAPLLRISASSAAEQARESLNRLLKERGRNWELPVVVTLRPRPVEAAVGVPAEVRAVQTVQGIRIEVNIWTGPSPVPVDFHRRIIHALLLERALRGQGATLPAKMADVPVWLSLGLAELTSTTSLPRPVYTGLLESGNIPELDVFVTNPPAPQDASTDATLYRAYAAALVSSVLSQPEGQQRLDQLISDTVLNPSPGGLASLEPVFEASGGIEPFRKKWALALAVLGRADASKALTVEASTARLREALQWPIYLPGANQQGHDETIPLREAAAHASSRSVKKQLREASAKLIAEAATANPIVAPLYGQLAGFCSTLANGKAKKPEIVIARIETTLEEISALATQITDHINWVEATQVRPDDNPFENYFRMAQSLSREQKRQPPRGGDPVASYLDGMERILE